MSAFLDIVRQAVADICRTPIGALNASTRSSDVRGWDSFGRLQVVLELERVLDRDLPLEEAFAATSIGELTTLVSRAAA